MVLTIQYLRMLDFSTQMVRDVTSTYSDPYSPWDNNFTSLGRSCSLIGHPRAFPDQETISNTYPIRQVLALPAATRTRTSNSCSSSENIFIHGMHPAITNSHSWTL